MTKERFNEIWPPLLVLAFIIILMGAFLTAQVKNTPMVEVPCADGNVYCFTPDEIYEIIDQDDGKVKIKAGWLMGHKDHPVEFTTMLTRDELNQRIKEAKER